MPEQVLRDAEQSAKKSKRDSSDDGAVDEARAAEGEKYYTLRDRGNGTFEAEEHFRSNVTGDKPDKAKKGSFKGGLKKKGPIFAIIGLLVVLAGLIFLAQSVMPFAIVNRLIEEYNTNGISSVLRSDNILDIQLSAAPGSTFSLSESQIASLKENNVLPISHGNGTLLAYEQSGEMNAWKVAYGTEQSSVSVTDVASVLASTYTGYTFGKVSLISVQDAMQDGDFKTPYTTASKTWRGGNSGWYDELTDLAEEVHGFSRSRWFNFGAKAVTNGITAMFKSIAKANVSKDSANVAPEAKTDIETGEETVTTSAKLSKGLDIAGKFLNAASGAATLTCAAVEGFIGVQTLLTAYQRLQKINLTAGFMEAVQSVQAGSSSGDPMHEYGNRLTTNNEETGKNAMSSSGMDSLFNGTPINTDDPSVQSINAENTLSSISNSNDDSIMALFGDMVGNAKNLLSAYKTCNYVKGGLAIANAVVTALSVIPIIGQGIKVLQISFTAIIKSAFLTIIQAAAPAIAKAVISKMGEKIMNDMATEWLGEDLGNALLSGGNSLLSSNHQTGGGSPGSPAKVAAFRQEQERIIAEEAEYQRQIRSPFDITSQHTFLGSIVYSLVPMANSTGVGSTLKSISSVMTNSVSKLLPTVAAKAETDMVDVAKEGDCPILQNIETKSGTVEIQADVFCNPVYITDQETSVSDYTPEEIVQQELSWGYITKDDNGKITIKDNTNMSRYITFCGQRTSSWGVADANIIQAIANGVANSFGILGSLPIGSDVKEITTVATALENVPWTTGGACVASEANEYWCENRIHQRFVEDQRLFTDAGVVKDNPVVAYLEDYYEKNPLDNSFEGILARYSGMTKDDVIATLELMEGLEYIANYHPEERYAFGSTEPKEIFFEYTEETLIATEPKYIVYNTLRERANAIL